LYFTTSSLFFSSFDFTSLIGVGLGFYFFSKSSSGTVTLLLLSESVVLFEDLGFVSLSVVVESEDEDLSSD